MHICIFTKIENIYVLLFEFFIVYTFICYKRWNHPAKFGSQFEAIGHLKSLEFLIYVAIVFP